jgi:uncharacterized peroxidase-related enzyme
MIDPAGSSGRLKTLLDALVARRGRVSNMVRVLANSSAATAAYFSFNSNIASGVLSSQLRERIAIAVAEANSCATCLAAHTEFGRLEGLPDSELQLARVASSEDAAAAVALRFAISVMKTVGHVTSADLAAVRIAGFDDAAIIEITATVFINVFTNAVNHLAETTPDYPAVPALAASAVRAL